MRTGIILIVLVTSISTGFSQSDKTEVKVEYKGCGDKTRFHLRQGFKKQESYYVEGKFVYFISSDSSLLTIHCGGNTRIPLLQGDKYQVTKKDKRDRQGTIKGTKYYWREINLTTVNICYEYIKLDNKDYFDNLLVTLKCGSCSP